MKRSQQKAMFAKMKACSEKQFLNKQVVLKGLDKNERIQYIRHSEEYKKGNYQHGIPLKNACKLSLERQENKKYEQQIRREDKKLDRMSQKEFDGGPGVAYALPRELQPTGKFKRYTPKQKSAVIQKIIENIADKRYKNKKTIQGDTKQDFIDNFSKYESHWPLLKQLDTSRVENLKRFEVKTRTIPINKIKRIG